GLRAQAARELEEGARRAAVRGELLALSRRDRRAGRAPGAPRLHVPRALGRRGRGARRGDARRRRAPARPRPAPRPPPPRRRPGGGGARAGRERGARVPVALLARRPRRAAPRAVRGAARIDRRGEGERVLLEALRAGILDRSRRGAGGDEALRIP